MSFIGDIEYLPKHLLKKIKNITQKYDVKYNAELIIAWNYGGRQEIINVVNKLIKQIALLIFLFFDIRKSWLQQYWVIIKELKNNIS